MTYEANDSELGMEYDNGVVFGALLMATFLSLLVAMALNFVAMKIRVIPLWSRAVIALLLSLAGCGVVTYRMPYPTNLYFLASMSVLPLVSMLAYYRHASLPASGFRRVGAAIAVIAFWIGAQYTFEDYGNPTHMWAATAFIVAMWSSAITIRWIYRGFKPQP